MFVSWLLFIFVFFSLQFNDYFFHFCFVNQPPTIITREFYYTKCILHTKYWLLPMCYWYWYGMVYYSTGIFFYENGNVKMQEAC